MVKAQMVTVTDESGNETVYTLEAFEAKRNQLLADWEKAKQALASAKELEMEYRKEFVQFASDSSKEKGTENIELDNGFKAKVVKKINYGFIQDDDGKVDKPEIEKALDCIASTGEAGRLIASRLVKWTPSLSQTEYKLLPADWKETIDEVLVTKASAPTLAIVAPKAKK